MKTLVAVDGSEAALDAVRHALYLQREGLKLTLVLATVQAPTYLYDMVLPPDSDVLEKVSGAVGGRALEGAEALCVEAGMPFEREIGSGEPAPTLIEIAERYNCKAIILGARGLGALRGALLGSVSQAVSHTSKVPVTVVRRTSDRSISVEATCTVAHVCAAAQCCARPEPILGAPKGQAHSGFALPGVQRLDAGHLGQPVGPLIRPSDSKTSLGRRSSRVA